MDHTNELDLTEKDVQFAQVLLDHERISESELASVVSNWSSQSGIDFPEYLVSSGLIADAERNFYESKLGLASKTVNDSSMNLNATPSGNVDSEGDPTNSSGQDSAKSEVNYDKTLELEAPLTDSSSTQRVLKILNSSVGEDQINEVRKLDTRYELIRKIGQGGLGTVWLAHDHQLKRNVAIKELNSKATQNEHAIRRFRREAEITGQLEHPNVVSLYQFAIESETGKPSYAMRFVGKKTLQDAIDEHHANAEGGSQAIALHKLLTAFVGACQAIAYAHSRGVIHRDLKPENVALDNFGQVIVLDWGLAKSVNDHEIKTSLQVDGSEDPTKTMEGQLIGTPMFMSPEQARGDMENIDKRTDIYQLGAMLFAILTGAGPHHKTIVENSGVGVVRKLLESIISKPSPKPRDYKENIPVDLSRICRKAMAKDPTERYESVSRLADDVQMWMAGQAERRQKYEMMRLEGRELAVNLGYTVGDLSKNVRFMSRLPPIQGIVDRINTEDENENGENGLRTWRDRLKTIYQGLLHTNSDYYSISFCQTHEKRCRELVRVERHSSDVSNIRPIPRSRLRDEPTNQMVELLMQEKPEEVLISLCNRAQSIKSRLNQLRLGAGVPVFDEITEDPFGFVFIECDLLRVLDREIRNRVRNACDVIVTDEKFSVILHEEKGRGRVENTIGFELRHLISDIQPAMDRLRYENEFVDLQDRNLFANRVFLDSTFSSVYLFLIVDRQQLHPDSGLLKDQL